jgi:uncharacterized membrane protein
MIDANAGELFRYLSDVRNLPRYFSGMTSAEAGRGEEVHTTARLPDGREAEGTAWFRVREDGQRIEWGTEGPSDYGGYLDVRAAGNGSEIQVHLHTTRVPDGDEDVTNGIRETLANIKRQAEDGHPS